MAKNKIGWCDITWNPVWGCNNPGECRKYCYARKIAKRFAKIIAEKEIKYCIKNHYGYYEDLEQRLYNFEPILLLSHYFKSMPKKPQKIFVGSMSEIYFWEEEWMVRILEKIKRYPQHIFQFLTKFPIVYEKYDFPDNCWLGMTITKREEFRKIDCFFGAVRKKDNIKYLSIEPIHSHIEENILGGFDWVIVGAQTGNNRGKIIPKREWIDYIVDYCKENNIPIFLKDNLKDIYPNLIQEFPKRR